MKDRKARVYIIQRALRHFIIDCIQHILDTLTLRQDTLEPGLKTYAI
jgi:hypothetical protein